MFSRIVIAPVVVSLLLAACGGGIDSSGGTSTVQIGGTVSGLATGASVVLQNNGQDATTVTANGSFNFPTMLASGAAYAVTVSANPNSPAQTCAVTGGTGTATANVTGVTINCTMNSYTLGGTLSGLAAGQSVVLVNGAVNLTVNANGSFSFPAAIASGTAYSVTVGTQPVGQICTVTNGGGTVAAAAVSNVAVTCSSTSSSYSVSGSIIALAGSGLVLQNNGGNNQTPAAGATSFGFPPAASGSPYAVTVLTNPTSPSQTCTVTNGSGTGAGGNVTNVTITCVTRSFPVNVTVSGLSGTGLILRNNGGNDLTITGNSTVAFTTPVLSGSAYAVTVFAQPTGPTQSCSVTGSGSGTMGNGAVTVNVTCGAATATATIGGTVTGLTGTGLQLRNNGGDTLSISGNGSFSFATAIPVGSAYSVTVGTQPTSPSQTCSVSNGSGTVGSGNITNVTVTCGAPSSFAVNVAVSGLSGTGLVLRNNGGDFLTVTTNGTVPFATPVPSGSPYAVTIAQQPTGQTCSVTGSASGTVGNGPVTVTMTCSGGASTFTIGGTVSGLSGSGLQLTNNGGNTLSISANGSFTFSTAIASGATYSVAVSTQPSSQTCAVTNGSGTVGSGNVTNVAVTCTTSSGTRTIGGTVSGLSGLGLLLRNNGGDTLAVSLSGAFTFATPLAGGASYAVTVFQQPSSPTQTCTVSNGTGTVGSSNVTNVAVSCTGGGGGSGKFAFYSNESGTPRVASYSVGANGGFSQVSALAVQSHSSISGALATGVAVTAAGNYVIVAVDASDGADVDGELQVYAVNSSGQLSWASTAPVSHLPYCGSLTSGSISCGIGINSAPETVVIHPNGRFVYVMDGVAGGACNPPGVSPCSPPAGFPASGNRVIVRYSFDPATATLTFMDRHYVEGFVSFAMDPQGRFLWATSYLERKIYEFRINQSDGSLTFGTGTFIGMSNGDMWLGIDPNGNYAYAAHEGDGTIDSYTINSSTGHLTNIGAINGDCSAQGANCNKANGIYVWGLAVSANGRTLYGASGGVTAYALGADGRIDTSSRTSYNPATPLNGGGYRALVGVGSNGQYLYLQGYNDSAARVYSINSSTGVLTETGASPTPLASGAVGTTAIALQ